MDALTSRRDFLRCALAAAAAVALPPGTLRAHSAPRLAARGTRKRVVVLGAGLAGLSAAHELIAAGHDVVILEARLRAGGRVYTLREPFSDGLHAEAGATRISELNDWTMKYVQQFGLALEPFKSSGLRDVYHLRGQRVIVADGTSVDWPVALTAEERRLGLAGMRTKYLGPALEAIGDAGFPDPPAERLHDIDALTYYGYLRRQGASPAAIDLLTMGSNYNEREYVSALMRLRNLGWRLKTQRWTKIVGGTDNLPKAFAATMADRIHYGTAVVRIEQSTTGVRIAALRAGVPVVYEGDCVLCTIPLPVLHHMGPQPAFSAQVHSVIRALKYAETTKVFVQTKTRFWEAEGMSGFGTTDRPIQEVWNMTAGRQSSRGILLAYMTGENAIRTSRMPPEERVRWGAGEIDRLFPGTLAALEGGTSYSWGTDPWARGAYALSAPNQMRELQTVLRRAHGRVYFAGEHASAWPGWMQGALESGNHAARAIDAA
ncbi:MAG TPA: FAD-dependent oxidoreductase [Gemmatimonadaceae bacterium]|nr:FAD-dependent oxidoreductase [Gemmatimonadaceae bacterium]